MKDTLIAILFILVISYIASLPAHGIYDYCQKHQVTIFWSWFWTIVAFIVTFVFVIFSMWCFTEIMME